ncbi:MAG: hypothetical protein H7289_07140 [Mucilaginibacter sp.]|nr:hypothetical protein [Mucilaginibacter sp.]
MKNNIKYLLMSIVAIALMQSCKKSGFNGLTDNRPAVPVTVANAQDYRPDPTVFASRATGAITITLSIPASTGRTIKEITRVSANTTQTQVQGTTGLYNTAVIAGTGTTVTFNTTFTEYIAKAAGVIPAANSTELAKRFYFLITLDNGDTIIPEPVRVVVIP